MPLFDAASFPLRHGRRLLLACTLAACSQAGHAALSFSWSLIDWEPVVAPTDTLVLRGQLFNDHHSTELLFGNRLLERSANAVADVYLFEDALPTLAEQLQGLALNPGEGIDFVFGRLRPAGGSAATGFHLAGGFSLAFADQSGKAVWHTPDRDLWITVQQPGPGGNVPVPGVPMLLLAAGLAAGLVRLRRGGAGAQR
jgi:hypothetical protein